MVSSCPNWGSMLPSLSSTLVSPGVGLRRSALSRGDRTDLAGDDGGFAPHSSSALHPFIAFFAIEDVEPDSLFVSLSSPTDSLGLLLSLHHRSVLSEADQHWHSIQLWCDGGLISSTITRA